MERELESGARDAASIAALRAHPDFARWMTHDPDARDARRGCTDLVWLALLAVGGVAATLACLAFLPQLAILPLALLGLGLLGGLAQLVRRPARLPLERWPARALAVHARVAAREGSASQSRYGVLFENEEGRSLELEAAPETVADLQAESLGIAFSRGSELVRFVPLLRLPGKALPPS